MNQLTSLSLRYIIHGQCIVNNKALTEVEQSEQRMFILKLGFAKAYDTVDWGLLIQALGRLGICESFIQIIELLFVDAHAMVNINGQPTNHFLIRRGVL